jgi:hypothetical protein
MGDEEKSREGSESLSTLLISRKSKEDAVHISSLKVQKVVNYASDLVANQIPSLLATQPEQKAWPL